MANVPIQSLLTKLGIKALNESVCTGTQWITSIGSENREITHAIGLQFVGWWAAVFLKPFEDVLLEIFKVHAYFLAASVIQPSCLPAAKLIKSMCRNYRVAQTRTESKRL